MSPNKIWRSNSIFNLCPARKGSSYWTAERCSYSQIGRKERCSLTVWPVIGWRGSSWLNGRLFSDWTAAKEPERPAPGKSMVDTSWHKKQSRHWTAENRRKVFANKRTETRWHSFKMTSELKFLFLLSRLYILLVKVKITWLVFFNFQSHTEHLAY